MKHENILLKSALALAIVDLALIAAILLQVNNLVKDVLEVQNRQLEIGVMRERMDRAEETKKREAEFETSGWEVYSNRIVTTKVGFSLKFPPDFVVEKTLGGYILKPKSQSEKLSAIIIEGHESVSRAAGEPEKSIRSLSLQDKQEEIVTINNATIFRLTGIDATNQRRTFAVWRENVAGRDYVVEFSTTITSPDITDEIGIFDEIVSTFKLGTSTEARELEQSMGIIQVSSNPITGWKIYKNNQYHYQIEFPNDWLIDDFSIEDLRIIKQGMSLRIIVSSRGFMQDKDGTEKISLLTLDKSIKAEQLEYPYQALIYFKFNNSNGFVEFNFAESRERQSENINALHEILNTFKLAR